VFIISCNKQRFDGVKSILFKKHRSSLPIHENPSFFIS